jgi:hypothetical protein
MNLNLGSKRALVTGASEIHGDTMKYEQSATNTR